MTDLFRKTSSAKTAFRPSDVNLKAWSEAIGVNYQPFAKLEASADPWLSRYLVDLAAFDAAWGAGTSVLLAPGGGGKTALRVRVAQNCWAGQETLRPFPLSYQPPLQYWNGARPTFDQHMAALSQACASFLLLTLAHMPHWFLDLSDTDRRRTAQVLLWSLGAPLQSYLEPCQEEGSLEPMRERFAPGLLPPILPSVERQTEFFSTFIAQSKEVESSSIPAPAERWEGLSSVLLDTLGLPTIYILLDGLDSILETANDPVYALRCLEPLLEAASGWTEKKIFLKLFIPSELGPVLEHRKALFRPAFQAEISWTPERLVEMVRRRLFVASSGLYESLDQISSPGISGLDETIVSAVASRPRDVLVTLQHLIHFHVQFGDRSDPLFQIEDIERALAWYRQDGDRVPGHKQPHIPSKRRG